MNSERRGAAVQSAHVFHGGFDLRCDEIRCGGGCRRRGGTYTLILIHLYTLEKECIGSAVGGVRCWFLLIFP